MQKKARKEKLFTHEARCAGLNGLCAAQSTGELDLRMQFADGILKVYGSAEPGTRVTSLRVSLPYAFGKDDRILLNGYQCWTRTLEAKTNGKMLGIKQVPKKALQMHALERSGDYQFAKYTYKQGILHGWTYGYARTPANLKDSDKDRLELFGPPASKDDRYCLWASLNEDDGFTCIEVDTKKNAVVLDKECSGKVWESADERLLASFIIKSGSEDQVFDAWFAAMGVTPREFAPLFGYTSWYRHYEKISARKLRHDLGGMYDAWADLATNGLDGGMLPVFQIDDGWEKTVGCWKPRRMFGAKMADLAGEILACGFEPGLWIAPFAVTMDAPVFKEHPEWLVTEKGYPVKMGSNWGGYYALDLSQQPVRDYVSGIIKTATREWGFRLLKLDFLHICCAVKRPGWTRGAQMADALELLREAAGENVKILACGVPLGSCFGKVEYARVGCDVGLDFDDKPHMRLSNRERVSTKTSLQDAYFRRQLDGRAFLSDPDVFFIRKKDVKLSKKQRKLMAWVQQSCGSVHLTSDDMGAYSKKQMAELRSLVKGCRR